VRPLELVQSEGYITVGSKSILTMEKDKALLRSFTEVMDQVQRAATKGCQTRGPLFCGNIFCCMMVAATGLPPCRPSPRSLKD